MSGPRQSSRLFALAGAVLAFLIASALPVWSVWYFNEWEGVGYGGTFWSAQARFVRNARDPDLAGRLLDLYGADLVLLVVILVGGYGAGWLVGWWRARHLAATSTGSDSRPDTG
jgi:hypothetical protein